MAFWSRDLPDASGWSCPTTHVAFAQASPTYRLKSPGSRHLGKSTLTHDSFTLRPTPYTLHPTFYTPHPTPYNLNQVHPCTLNPELCSLDSNPCLPMQPLTSEYSGHNGHALYTAIAALVFAFAARSSTSWPGFLVTPPSNSLE